MCLTYNTIIVNTDGRCDVVRFWRLQLRLKETLDRLQQIFPRMSGLTVQAYVLLYVWWKCIAECC